MVWTANGLPFDLLRLTPLIPLGGIAFWVFGLFYGSWLLWAIAAGVATRSYQLRSAALRMFSPT